jgi:hypothetical protein
MAETLMANGGQQIAALLSLCFTRLCSLREADSEEIEQNLRTNVQISVQTSRESPTSSKQVPNSPAVNLVNRAIRQH